MRPFAAADLLEVWEDGLAQSPAQRALTLLARAEAGVPLEQLTQCSIGERDRHLLALRAQTFGPHLASIATCPGCGQQLEFTAHAGDLQAPAATAAARPLAFSWEAFEVAYRLPNSLDLAKLDPALDGETNRQILLQGCVLAAQRAGAPVGAAELPAELLETIALRLAEAGAEADVQLALSCPQCQHAWQAPLDIVSYFWSEIHAWALRLLQEVHLIASTYGWSEAAVVALSPRRRQAYLELIEA